VENLGSSGPGEISWPKNILRPYRGLCVSGSAHGYNRTHFFKTIIPSRKATKLYEEETGGDAVKYDKEEQFILDELEKGNVVLTGPTKEEIDSIRRTAQNTFKKDKRITIRLYDHDFIGIQKKALEMGIPYQTLISGLIHRYVEGDVKITSG
jgi:predicted DNA binding CopG/RHH family protein